MAAWLKAPEQQSLSRAFATWLKRLMAERIPDTHVPAVSNLVEFESMLAERITDWTREWKQQGLDEGIKQGIHYCITVWLHSTLDVTTDVANGCNSNDTNLRLRKKQQLATIFLS